MLAPTNKMAIEASWSFFKGNYALHFGVIAILIVCNLLGMLPIIGLLFIFAYSILSLAVQIYFGRVVMEANSLEEIEESAAQSRIGDLLTAYLQTAAGAFLALFLIALVFFFLMGLVISASVDFKQLENGAMMQAQVMGMLSGSGFIGLLLLLVAMFLFYFFPAVLGEVFKTDDFGTAFKRVFLLFSPAFWKRCFNKEYMILIIIWSLILLAVGIVMVLLAGTLILLPVVLVLAYLLSLYNAAIYVFASELAKE